MLNHMKYHSEYAHIVLISVCFLLAVILPFELFLFAYAVLGPLHYLTEIRWLHTKKYFIHTPIHPLFFCISVVAFLLLLSLFVDTVISILVTLFFFVICIFVFTKNWFYRLMSIFTLVYGAMFLNSEANVGIFVLLLLTVIHVYIFTLVFMIQSAIKNKSIVYCVAPAAHIAFGVLCFFVPVSFQGSITEYAYSIFRNEHFSFSSTFFSVGQFLFGDLKMSINTFLVSPEGISVSRFLHLPTRIIT